VCEGVSQGLARKWGGWLREHFYEQGPWGEQAGKEGIVEAPVLATSKPMHASSTRNASA